MPAAARSAQTLGLMFWRALFAFIAMPGMVAFAIPAIWQWQAKRLLPEQPLALAVLAAGTVGLLWCVRDFYVQGKGTLAPWSPTQNLVVVGLYRYSRNPMYVCVLLILLGWAAAFGSPGLLVYAAFIALAFHLRVVYGEEPWLAQKHGSAWQSYVNQVPRWLRLRARWGLTLRSSGPPPASRLARAPASVIIRCAGQAPSRWGPLSSNVRSHKTPCQNSSIRSTRTPAP
jgi:protein-S-isoprenylcysteine O-methyltransferase Ste14